jgi:UDP-4-amino-4,6-dideoxy-N-acetyl-beta-L-altrosamine transaminase/dTDP-4-dehydrorhamnose reductase
MNATADFPRMKKTRKKMLITGFSGLLGGNLAYYFRDKYEVIGCYNSHPVYINGVAGRQIDLTDKSEVVKLVMMHDPDVIIHCASLTNVDQCEEDRELANTVNVLSTRHLVEAAASKTRFVYISTDAVYNGEKGKFTEDDSIEPRNYYGQSKYEGETAVRQKENTLILRTNLFGWNIQEKQSLGEWIINELISARQIKGFQDAVFSTIYTFQLAKVIDIALTAGIYGVFNCGGSDYCSKYEFALKIADKFGFDKKLIIPSLLGEYRFKAQRGRNLSLNVSRLERALNYRLPTIDQSIDEFYRDYKCGLPQLIKTQLPEEQKKWSLIPYGRQWIDADDIEAVTKVLTEERITQGPQVETFEKKLAKYCRARYAVAVNSGTAALHLACLAVRVVPEDEIITSPITFVASANCALYCNAKPVFADIDPRTYNINPAEIEKRITARTKVILPVHFAGQSCDMETIKQIAADAEKKHGHKIYVVEDACHAMGSLYKNTKVGSCSFSDMTVTSFHPVKHITTGEGGAILTNDERLYKSLKILRSHGITGEAADFVNTDLAFSAKSHNNQRQLNPWYYEQVMLGYNYRITDIQCALGISQLAKLETFAQRRKQIVSCYNVAFGKIDSLVIPYEDKNCSTNFHLYVLLINFNEIGMDRAQFIMELRKQKIQTQVHYIPVHLQPYYQTMLKTKRGDYPQAEAYYQKCLSIPLYPAMSDSEVTYVIEKIKSIVDK